MNKNNLIFSAAIIVILIGGAFLVFSGNNGSSESTIKPVESPGDSYSSTQTPMQSSSPLPKPEMTLDLKKSYEAVLHTTEGDITISFDTKNSPITSNNFIYLSKNHFYDNTIFHRVLSGFMIQGGDPQGTGMGGPGYKFDDEYLQGSYKRGAVAMANAGPDTNGSQFFIMHVDGDTMLRKDYVVFGNVTAGMEIVDKIASAATVNQPGSPEKSKPVTPVHVTSVDIIEK